MHRHMLMNNYDIAGCKNIGANNDISAINDVNANDKLTGNCVETTSTSTFTGNK